MSSGSESGSSGAVFRILCIIALSSQSTCACSMNLCPPPTADSRRHLDRSRSYDIGEIGRPKVMVFLRCFPRRRSYERRSSTPHLGSSFGHFLAAASSPAAHTERTPGLKRVQRPGSRVFEPLRKGGDLQIESFSLPDEPDTKPELLPVAGYRLRATRTYRATRLPAA